MGLQEAGVTNGGLGACPQVIFYDTNNKKSKILHLLF
jgi:chemotaxis receptor (MCP) glutamine deamidase CheD